MNHAYRKKPVVIEAFQMTEHHRWHKDEWPNWLLNAWQTGLIGIVDPPPKTDGSTLVISTLEGSLKVSPDDWIIQGVQGEIYPCKPDIFEATYEKVDG